MPDYFPTAQLDHEQFTDDATPEQRMRSLIDTLSAYIETYHGGKAEMVEFDGQRLKVHLSGACDGCGLAPVTLHGWIEGTAKQFFPELKEVVAV